MLTRLLRATSATDQIRPWCSIDVDGGSSPDSCRPGRIPVTAELGHKRSFTHRNKGRLRSQRYRVLSGRCRKPKHHSCVFCRADRRCRRTPARRSSRGARCVAGRRNRRLLCAGSRDCPRSPHRPSTCASAPRFPAASRDPAAWQTETAGSAILICSRISSRSRR